MRAPSHGVIDFAWIRVRDNDRHLVSNLAVSVIERLHAEPIRLLHESGGNGWHALWAWLVVYQYGVASLTVFMATLRAIAEHQVDAQAPVVTGRAALRNFRDNPLSRLLLGAYGFSEHASHHLNPQVPSYRLTGATQDLIDRGRDDLRFGPGYTPTLWRLFRPQSR